jgi:hypothetical protein
MSCQEFVLSPAGRAGIGVDQQQFAGNYPFVAASADIKYLVADFYLVYDDQSFYDATVLPAKHPLSIKYLYGVGCSDGAPAGFPAPMHAADVQIVDLAGAVVFDSFAGGTYTVADWSSDYAIHEWKKDGAVCRLVAYKTWPIAVTDSSETQRRHHAKYLAPVSAVLDERAVYKMPKRLLSLRTKTGNLVSDKLAGDIAIKNGYNTEISVGAQTTQNFRADTRVVVAAAAGSGLGRFNNCATDTEENKPIVKINGVSPLTGGDFLLSSSGCLWAQRPVEPSLTDENGDVAGVQIVDTAHLKLGADCKPCCGCDDYVETAQYMNQVAYRYQLVGQRAESVYFQHENNVAQWSDNICDGGEILRVYETAQSCSYVDYAISLCNTCEKCIKKGGTFVVELYLPHEFADNNRAKTKNGYFGGTGNLISADIECGYTRVSIGDEEPSLPIVKKFNSFPDNPPDSGSTGSASGLTRSFLYPTLAPVAFIDRTLWPKEGNLDVCDAKSCEQTLGLNVEKEYQIAFFPIPPLPEAFKNYLVSKYGLTLDDGEYKFNKAYLTPVEEFQPKNPGFVYVYQERNNAPIGSIVSGAANLLATYLSIYDDPDLAAAAVDPTTMLVGFDADEFNTRIPINGLRLIDPLGVFAFIEPPTPLPNDQEPPPEPAKILEVLQQVTGGGQKIVWAKIKKPLDFPDMLMPFEDELTRSEIGTIRFYDFRYFYRAVKPRSPLPSLPIDTLPPLIINGPPCANPYTDRYLYVALPTTFEIGFPELRAGASLDLRFRVKITQRKTVRYIPTVDCETAFTAFSRELRIGDGLINVRENPLPEPPAEFTADIVGKYYAYIPAVDEGRGCAEAPGDRPAASDPWTVWEGYKEYAGTDANGIPQYNYKLRKIGDTETRQIAPTGAWPIQVIVTGDKPFGNLVDLSSMFVVSGCPGDATARRALVNITTKLNCTSDGSSISKDC